MRAVVCVGHSDEIIAGCKVLKPVRCLTARAPLVGGRPGATNNFQTNGSRLCTIAVDVVDLGSDRQRARCTLAVPLACKKYVDVNYDNLSTLHMLKGSKAPLVGFVIHEYEAQKKLVFYFLKENQLQKILALPRCLGLSFFSYK